MHGMQEVAGSIPTGSIQADKALVRLWRIRSLLAPLTYPGQPLCEIISFETAAAGHISPLRTTIACAILTAEKLLENTSGIDMVN